MTTQMKALAEYFPMVVFTLLLNRVHVFAIFMFDRETWEKINGVGRAPDVRAGDFILMDHQPGS